MKMEATLPESPGRPVFRPKKGIHYIQLHENGYCYVQLTDEIIESTGFKFTDTYNWINNGDNTFTLVKVEPWYRKVINFFKHG
jgi:hypothetical protein